MLQSLFRCVAFFFIHYLEEVTKRKVFSAQNSSEHIILNEQYPERTYTGKCGDHRKRRELFAKLWTDAVLSIQPADTKADPRGP